MNRSKLIEKETSHVGLQEPKSHKRGLYHVVFIPKCRRKVLYGKLRSELGPVLHELAKQRESKIAEGHLLPDHVHMMIQPPYAPSPRARYHVEELGYGAFGAHDQKRGNITKHRLSMWFLDGELVSWEKSTPVGRD